MGMAKHNVILDCDPGVDDAVALLLAFKRPDALNLVGISCVAGNVGLDKTTRNACLLREVAGREDVPVFGGADRPLVVEPVLADDFHGPEGLGDYPVFAPKKGTESQSAVAFIIETLRTYESGTITLAITGPLTNIAQAFQQAPDIIARVKQIVLMGGARSEGGNITASAEYNIYADPHAAAIVLQAKCPTIVLGLDATHQVRGTPPRIARLTDLGNEVAMLAADTLAFSNTLPGNMEGATGAPLHDPCVIAYLLAPALFTTRPCSIQVETNSTLTRGHTAVEFRPDYWGVVHHAHWVTHIDAEGIFDLLEQAFAS
jgi:purine nucleosidase